MEKTSFKKALIFLLPFLFFGLLTAVLFKPFILKHWLPIPGDILIGHYYPWKDQIWGGRIAGYPIKNFQIFDGILQTLPWRLLAIDQMKTGSLPFWNPYIMMGMPLLANLQAAVFYPFNILFFVLPHLDAWSLYIFCQPLLAGLFAYALGRSLQRSRLASLFLGTLYGFSLVMMNHLELGIDGHTALWLPLSLALINKIDETGKGRWAVCLAFSVLMTLLAGYPPPAIYSLIVITFYSIFKIRPLFGNKSLLIIFSLLIAFFLSAPQSLPFAELSRKVVRDENQFGVSSSEAFFIPWENLTMMLAPDFFGHAATNNFHSNFYFSDTPAIGIIGLLFVFYSLFFLLKKKEVTFWWLFSFFLFLLMLDTPFNRFLRMINLPFISSVSPIKMTWVTVLALAVLASFGFDYFISLLKEKNVNNFSKIVGPIFILYEFLLLLFSFAFLTLEGERLSVTSRNLFFPCLFIFVSSIVLLLINLFSKIKTIGLVFILLLSSLELLREGIKYNGFVEADLVYPQVEILNKNKDNYRFLTLDREMLPVNANIPYGLKTINGYASIYDQRSGQLVALANKTSPLTNLQGFPRTIFQTEFNSPMIDLLGVRYIYSLTEITSSKLQLLYNSGKTKIYENTNVFPRAFLTGKYFVAKNDLEIANRMLGIDLHKEVVLAEIPEGLVNNDNFIFSGEVKFLKEDDNHLEIKTISEDPALLLLTDTYDPGWLATIDGQKTKVLRADFNLRAVIVPKGEHLVNFVYFPNSYRMGLMLLALGLLLAVMVLPLMVKKRIF
ncbi:MAG: YfhO family protein [Patescibacteria group bacterium]|nr:YfhO family protein [Patescibacteria group bacterium]